MAAADATAAMQPIPKNVYTALYGDADRARERALAECQKASKRECAVIARGAVAH